MDGTIYAPLFTSSESAFRRFIAKARTILPSWWTDASLETCIKFSQ